MSDRCSVLPEPMEVDELTLKRIQIEQCKWLVEAATKGDYTTLVSLLDAGVSVNAEQYTKSLFYASQYYVTPLQLASEHNHLECVKELIQRGADVNCRDRFDVTAVHVAAEKGNVDVLRELLDSGAECNVPTKYSKKHSYTAVPHIGGTTPLHLAANHNHHECVRELIQCGADYNAIDERGRTSLYIAAQNGFTDCVLAHLQTAIGKDILSLPGFDTGDTPLHFAVQNAMVESVEALLDAGSDPNHKNFAGFTPLHYAVYPMLAIKEEAAEKILHLLVLRGHDIDVNVTDRLGLTPLHYVAFSSGIRLTRRPSWAHFLIAYGADPEIKTARGKSLIEVEIKSQFDDYTILSACIQSLLHPPVVSITVPEEAATPPPSAANDQTNAFLAFRTNIHTIFAFYLMEERLEQFYVAHNEKLKKKIQWYHSAVAKPMSLQHYCRYTIRKTLGQKRLRLINDLPVPTRIKNYLLLQSSECIK